MFHCSQVFFIFCKCRLWLVSTLRSEVVLYLPLEPCGCFSVDHFLMARMIILCVTMLSDWLILLASDQVRFCFQKLKTKFCEWLQEFLNFRWCFRRKVICKWIHVSVHHMSFTLTFFCCCQIASNHLIIFVSSIFFSEPTQDTSVVVF